MFGVSFLMNVLSYWNFFPHHFSRGWEMNGPIAISYIKKCWEKYSNNRTIWITIHKL
jgi:hypothetical protein